MSRRIVEPALAVPPLAIEPVYSTWYTFIQDVNAEVIESEAALAVPMGCGSVFIDDGWKQLAVGRGYQGCGDWVPDTDKFPDLLAHIRRVRALGAGVVLWVAPLLLGTDSDAYADLAEYAPLRRTPTDCFILDPRHRTVREHLADVCLRLVTDYGSTASRSTSWTWRCATRARRHGLSLSKALRQAQGASAEAVPAI